MKRFKTISRAKIIERLSGLLPKLLSFMFLILLGFGLVNNVFLSYSENPNSTLALTPPPLANVTPTTTPTPTPTTTPTPTPTTTPTPTPTTTPTPSSDETLVVVPDDWVDEINAWSYIHLDTSVYRSAPSSMCLEPDHERGSREINADWFNVQGGDRIVWRIWCKTSECYSTDIAAGGRIGIDLYGRPADDPWAPEHQSVIVDSLPHDYIWVDGELYSGTRCNPNYEIETMPLIPKSQFTVDWGTSDWKLICYDFVIPEILYYQKTNSEYLSEPHVIVGCIPWVDARAVEDAGIAWFDDSEFLINPTSTSYASAENSLAFVILIVGASVIVSEKFKLYILKPILKRTSKTLLLSFGIGTRI